MKKILIFTILFVYTSSVYSQEYEDIKYYSPYLPMSYEVEQQELEDGKTFRQYIFTVENVDIILDDIFDRGNELKESKTNGFDLLLTNGFKFSIDTRLLFNSYSKKDLENYAINQINLLKETEGELPEDIVQREYKVVTIDGIDVLIFTTKYHHTYDEGMWITSYIYSIDQKLIELRFSVFFNNRKTFDSYIEDDFIQEYKEHFITIKRRSLE